MKTIIYSGLVLVSQIVIAQPVLAGQLPIPEMDGSGAIIGIALVAGLVLLIREKFFRK